MNSETKQADQPGPEQPPAAQGRRWRRVYAVMQRGRSTPIWQRVGVAYVNQDGSADIELDCLPLHGRLRINAPKDDQAQQPETGGDQ